MARKRLHECPDEECWVGHAFQLLGQADILNLLFVLVHEDRRPWRFGELKQRLGLAANILTDRLRALADAGLVTRTEYAEMPPRVEYAATPDAIEMDAAFREFDRWAAKRHKLRAPT